MKSILTLALAGAVLVGAFSATAEAPAPLAPNQPLLLLRVNPDGSTTQSTGVWLTFNYTHPILSVTYLQEEIFSNGFDG